MNHETRSKIIWLHMVGITPRSISGYLKIQMTVVIQVIVNFEDYQKEFPYV
jgi:hypothetical protein